MAQLPDCLISFSIQNYKGIKHAECDGLEDANWVFLTGENGSGKTSVLQAISNTLIEELSFLTLKLKFPFMISTTEVHYQTTFKKETSKSTPKEIIKAQASKPSDLDQLTKPSTATGKILMFSKPDLRNKSSMKNILTYGPIRLNIQAEETKNEMSRKNETGYSLFYLDGILLNVQYDLLLWELEKDPKFEYVKSIFKSIIPSLDDIIRIERDILYIEKDASGSKFDPVTFEQLPSGYQSLIALVGDMYIRLSKNQPNTPAEEMAGVVIIDELDMHLHPLMQKKLPGLLTKAFPKVQFIASTHSPIPLLGAPENSVFIKVERTEEKGVTCEKLDIKVEDLTPNLILTSPLFGISIISPNKNGNLEEVHTEDAYEELLKNEATKKKLKALYQSGKTFSDELFE